jgi:glucuronoarabinoxylan endo-1,4-beta-xylanase
MVFIAFCCWQLGMSAHSLAQTAVVKGTVSTSTVPVRYATIIFTETDRPASTFTVFTDSTGKYQLSLNLTSVAPGASLPTSFALGQNYPNPFSSSTAISYDLKSPADCSIAIYDILGRTVTVANAGTQAVGAYSVRWDGSNSMGQKVAPGTYFYRMRAGSESQTRKMIFTGGGHGAIPLQSGSVAPIDIVPPSLHRGSVMMSYAVQIQNGASTNPTISSKTVAHILLEGDTTLNFTVDSLAIPVSVVEMDSVQQHIRGFGGANIIPWRAAMTDVQTQRAFGAGPGELGFSILRLRVPFDTSAAEKTLDVAVAQKAQALGAIVFASPWTPPPVLKSSSNIVGGRLNDSSYAAYADHLKWFTGYMANNGAPLYAISIQNEPDITVTYESCDWNATQILRFLKIHAGAIGTKVMAPESFHFNQALSDSTLNDPAAAANLGIIGGHIYGGGVATYPLAVSKGKEVWMTEYLDTLRTWSAVLNTGRGIHDCMNVGWNAYVWWYIVRYYGPLDEDGTVTKRGYVMSQYARFVRPGYYKIKCHPTPQRNVYVSSYKDPVTSKVVIVALNSGTTSLQQTFAFTRGSITAVSQYTTTQTKNCEKGADFSIMAGRLTVTLEPSSITTFVSH